MNLWSIPSPGLELIFIAMAGTVLDELYGTPLVTPSWYSGSEWGWTIGIPWNPNFLCPKECPFSPCPEGLLWLPTEGTLTGEDKLWGTLEEIPWTVESSNGLTGALTAERRSWTVPLSNSAVIDPKGMDPEDTNGWISIRDQRHYHIYIGGEKSKGKQRRW